MRNASIGVVLLILVTGCFSKTGNSKIPDSISNLNFAVMQHYGSPLGGEVSLTKFVNAFQNVVGAGAKISWKNGDNGTYIMSFERFDDATRTNQTMAWVFSKIDKQAVVTRLVVNGEEINSFQLGVVMNQFTYPVYAAITESEKAPTRAPASK